MDYFSQKFGGKCRFAWMAVSVGVACLALAGCSTVDSLRGEGFHDNSMSDAIRETQPAPKKPQEFWSFSNKAREIEADFPDP